jgi:hypothetical protein
VSSNLRLGAPQGNQKNDCEKAHYSECSGEEKTRYKGSRDFFHKSAARFKETLALRKDNSKNDPSAVSGKASVWFYLRQNRLSA